mgnify:CR=1 FL=1
MWAFFNLFYKSPIELINEHFKVVSEVYELAKLNFNCWREGKEFNYEVVDQKEHEADIIREKVSEVITTSLMSSLRKEDILSLVWVQDEIADACQDLMHILDFKRVKLTPEMTEKFRQIFEITDKAMTEYSALLNNFYNFSRADWAPRYKRVIPQEIENISKFEKDIDRVKHSLGKIIYNSESTHSAIEIYFISKMTIIIDRTSNELKRAAERIKRMIAK